MNGLNECAQILEPKLPKETISYILDLLGQEWEATTKELCQCHFPKSEFNLAKYFIENLLVHFVQNKDRDLVRELNYMSRNFRALNIIIEKYYEKPFLFKKHIFKNHELKEFIKIFLKDKINLSFQIEAPTLLLYCQEFLKKNNWWNTKPTKRNNLYSEPKWCIKELLVLYYSLNKEIPECRHNGSQEGTEREFSGTFYDFLIEIKPLLKRFGIDLGKENSIGVNACTAIREHKKYLDQSSSFT